MTASAQQPTNSQAFLSWGLVGAVVTCVSSFVAVLADKKAGDLATSFFLWLGFNPREDAPLCLVLMAILSLITGFIGGYALRRLWQLAFHDA